MKTTSTLLFALAVPASGFTPAFLRPATPAVGQASSSWATRSGPLFAGMARDWKKKDSAESSGGPNLSAATIPVLFKTINEPENDVSCMAIPGEPLSDVALKADVFIK